MGLQQLYDAWQLFHGGRVGARAGRQVIQWLMVDGREKRNFKTSSIVQPEESEATRTGETSNRPSLTALIHKTTTCGVVIREYCRRMPGTYMYAHLYSRSLLYADTCRYTTLHHYLVVNPLYLPSDYPWDTRQPRRTGHVGTIPTAWKDHTPYCTPAFSFSPSGPAGLCR